MQYKGKLKGARKAQKEVCEKCPDHGICVAETRKEGYFCIKDDPRNPRNM